MKSTPDLQNEELFTRWIDRQLSPSEAEAVMRELEANPALREESAGIRRTGDLLRLHLPATLEPPSADFFTSRIMEEIEREAAPAASLQKAKSGREPAFLRWLRSPWFAPVTTAAAVAITLAVVNRPIPEHGHNGPPGLTAAARTYAPNPNVTANAYFSENAGAVVIDLQGLDAVPDDREIRAFDIASAEPVEPGMPRTFYAAGKPDRAVAVLTSTLSGQPAVRELH